MFKQYNNILSSDIAKKKRLFDNNHEKIKFQNRIDCKAKGQE